VRRLLKKKVFFQVAKKKQKEFFLQALSPVTLRGRAAGVPALD